MSAYHDMLEAVFDHRYHTSYTAFICIDAPEHGWHIDPTEMARKDDLIVTGHQLHTLVKQYGWRRAERVIMEVNAR